MKRKWKPLFISLVLFYALGVFIGAVWEVRTPNQGELYSFLKEGIKGYEAEGIGGIKAAATEKNFPAASI